MKYEDTRNLEKIKSTFNQMIEVKSVDSNIQSRLDFARNNALASWPKTIVKDKYSLFDLIFKKMRYRAAFTFVSLSILAAFVIMPSTSDIIDADKIDSISNYSMLADDIDLQMEII